jgi:exonuclease SbcD
MGATEAVEQDFCFVHAADLHLDTPFKGIGETAPFVGQALREASLDAFDSLVDLCCERRAAFLVLAGDIYDGPERGIRAQLRFHKGLARLSDAGILTFVVHGNHDPVESGWTAIGSWPELVTIFGTDEVEAVPVVRDGVQIAVVQGISYWRRDVRENLARRFSSRPEAGPGIRVGILHCDVTGQAASGGIGAAASIGAANRHDGYSPCSLEDLVAAGIDYWALGHIHGRSVLAGRPFGDEPWVAYPGNLQARSPKASERGAKGAIVVNVIGGRVAGTEFVACDRIRFSSVVADVTHLSSLEGLRDALVDAGRDELDRANGRSILLRASLTGRGTLHAMLGLGRPGALDELLASVRDEFYEAEPWCWWDRVDDATAAAIDVGQLRRGSDFAADLIAVAEEIAERAGSTGMWDAPGTCDSPLTIGSELLDELTATLPKALRRRASELANLAVLDSGLTMALDKLGAGEGMTRPRREGVPLP